MKIYVRISAFLIFLSAISAFANTTTAYCLRCHGMETLAYRDKSTGNIVNLYVDPQQYRQSNHSRLECVTCHTADYSHYPHPENAENLYCLDCHKDDPKLIPYGFVEIEQAFKNSIHASIELSCFSCHDPHQFKLSGEDSREIVRYDNEICLNCHASPLLVISHQWLPKPLLHWRSIRCLECHTRVAIHQILPAKESVKNCVECHSKEATLLSRLYDLQKSGWFNKAVFNDPYIIGMSRHESIDRWSLIILVFTIGGLFAHGLGRFLTRSNKK